MAGVTSTIPTFLVGLQAALKAALAAESVNATVTLGPPKPGEKLARVWAMVGPDIRNWNQEYRALPAGGTAAKSEDYVIDVLVDVLRSGVDQAAVNAEAFDVVAELEELCRSDVRASWYTGPGQIVSVEVQGGKGLQMRATTEDREAAVEVEVLVTARI